MALGREGYTDVRSHLSGQTVRKIVNSAIRAGLGAKAAGRIASNGSETQTRA